MIDETLLERSAKRVGFPRGANLRIERRFQKKASIVDRLLRSIISTLWEEAYATITQAFDGITRVAFLGFFGSHIVFTLIIDLQAILPSIFPSACKELLQWHIEEFKDPLMAQASELLWFRSLIVLELLFQLPFFVVAINFLRKNELQEYPDWFRTACIAYGAHTATTMAPILTTLATNSDATAIERFAILNVYSPYMIFPLWILYLGATSSSTTTGSSSNKYDKVKAT